MGEERWDAKEGQRISGRGTERECRGKDGKGEQEDVMIRGRTERMGRERERDRRATGQPNGGGREGKTGEIRERERGSRSKGEEGMHYGRERCKTREEGERKVELSL